MSRQESFPLSISQTSYPLQQDLLLTLKSKHQLLAPVTYIDCWNVNLNPLFKIGKPMPSCFRPLSPLGSLDI